MATKERIKNESGIHGKYYERGIATWIALKCLSDKNVRDYWIRCNPGEIKTFDDVILYVEYETGEDEVLFFQLKHKRESGVPFRPLKLKNDKNLKLSIYERDYLLITKDGNRLWEKLEINENTKKSFCLFTNYVTTEQEDETESVFNLQLIKVGEINNLADTSIETEIPSIYKVSDPKKKRNEIFLKDFYLWLNQVDDDKITERISNFFRIKETAVECLKYFFVRHFEPPKKGEINTTDGKFTRKDMIRKMLEIFIEDYQFPNYISCEDDRSWNVLNIINSYDLTVIKQRYSEERIWSDIYCKMGSEQGYSPRIRTGVEGKKDLNIYLDLVCKSEIPFFIRTSNPLFESFQNYFLDVVCMSTVIFLDDKENVSVNKKERKVLEFLTDLTGDLIKFCSPHSPKISFQGKKGIDLLNFVKGSNKPNQRLEIDVLFKYIDKTIIIGQEHIFLDNYIKRKINVPVMRLDEKPSIEMKKSFCINIFYNCPKKKGSLLGLVDVLDFIENPKQNRLALNFFSTSPFSMAIIEKLNALRKGGKKHIHIFEKMNDSDFFIPIYREGYGDCEVMKKLTSEQIDDVNIINFCKQNKINIICNNAGEGKTVLLKYISSLFPLNVWVVNINLRNASNLAVAKDPNVFIQEIYNSEKKQTREKYHDVLSKIYRICIDKKKVIWLVDDYEEIETPQLTEILRGIRQAGMKTWITSRPFRKTDLEMDFGIRAMEMIPITPEEQTIFFENYFSESIGDENTHNVLETIDAIRKKMNKTFIGVFQQMTMLAEIFKFTQQLSNTEYEIIDLYEKFIELKTQCHKEHHQDIVKIMMQKIALIHFFSDFALSKFFDMKELYAQMKFFKEEYEKGSIITYITDDNRVIFSHETYAEYLAARWLAEKVQEGFFVEQARNLDNLETMKEIIKMLYTQKLGTVRYFFDAILTQKLPMLSAAVNRQYDLMGRLYLERGEIIYQRDILGRTLLHFLIGNQSQYEIQTNAIFLRQPHEENATFRAMDDYVYLSPPIGTEYSSEENQFLTWFNLYYELKDEFSSPSNIFQCITDYHLNVNLGQFILLSGSLALLDRLLSEGLMSLDNVEYEQKYLLFTHCIINKFSNIITQMDLSDLNITRTHILSHSFMSLLHLSIQFNSWEAFQILLRIENNLDNWPNDFNENTILHTACEVFDTKFIKALCQEGEFSTDYLNRVNDEKNTPFISSVISGNLRISEILYSKGAKVDHQNKNGFSAMHYACMKNFYECVQKLIEWRANIDFKNTYGLTPLCLAVKNNNKEIVELLVEENANLNIADRHGWTVLHHAVKHNNMELLKYLLEKGAKVGYKNKNGYTPLKLACYKRNMEAVDLIKPHDSPENVIKVHLYGKTIGFPIMDEVSFEKLCKRENYKIRERKVLKVIQSPVALPSSQRPFSKW